MNKHEPQPQHPGAIDDLTLQNMIRKRYNQKWPAVMVEMMKRVNGVNATWLSIMSKLMLVEGLSIKYQKEGQNLVVTVQWKDEQERHEITPEEYGKAMTYIEVHIMDILAKSPLMEKAQ